MGTSSTNLSESIHSIDPQPVASEDSLPPTDSHIQSRATNQAAQTTPPHRLCGAFPSKVFVEAALEWFEFGFDPIPIAPGTKKSAVKWDPWRAKLSPSSIVAHWVNYPNHEVGFIVGDQIIVFDTDSATSTAALVALETSFRAIPSMVVKTAKGEHHYFARASGSFARSDSHSTTDHPERIDVKTGPALVILPPSTGKVVAIRAAENSVAFRVVDQAFIDEVFRHNGKPPPRPQVKAPMEVHEPTEGNLQVLQTILRHVSADCGYDDWIHVGMALHSETAGCDDGLALFDSWSSTGRKYRGPKETDAKWRSFRPNEKSFTISTLFWMAGQEGCTKEMIFGEIEPFEKSVG